MEKQQKDQVVKFFDSFCSAMKSGDIDRVMEHYHEDEESIQILSNGQMIVGYEQIKKEYAVFLEEVEMIDFQVPLFHIVQMEERILLVIQLHGMARTKRTKVKLPYRGIGGIILIKAEDSFKMVYEHFTLID